MRNQLRESVILETAPTTCVARQVETPSSGGQAARGTMRQLASDLLVGQGAGVAITEHRVFPFGPTPARDGAMEPEVLRMQAHRVWGAAKARRQPGKIAAVFQAAADLLIVVGLVRSSRLANPKQRPAARPDAVGRAAEPLGDHRGRQAGGRRGPQQHIVGGRPAPDAARSDTETRAAGNDSVGGASEPARDVGDRLPVSVEPTQQLVLGLTPAPGQRSPRASLGQRHGSGHLRRPGCGSRRRSAR